MHPVAKPQFVSVLLWIRVVKKALQLLPAADAQDKALVFQADANTSLLDAIRQVPALLAPAAHCLSDLPPKHCPLTPQFDVCRSQSRSTQRTDAPSAAGRDMFLKNYTAAGQGGVHRVAVFDAHGAITCIVSQLDVLRLAPSYLQLAVRCFCADAGTFYVF